MNEQETLIKLDTSKFKYSLDYIVFRPKGLMDIPSVQIYFTDKERHRRAINLILKANFRDFSLNCGEVISALNNEFTKGEFSEEDIERICYTTMNNLHCNQFILTIHDDSKLPTDFKGRDILFRGRHKQTGEWLYTTSLYDLHPETIGQYTGVTDRKDNKVFEGDIITNHEDYQGYVFWYDYSHCWMVYDTPSDYTISLSDCEDCEVIGNVWDNPELLPKEDNENA